MLAFVHYVDVVRQTQALVEFEELFGLVFVAELYAGDFAERVAALDDVNFVGAEVGALRPFDARPVGRFG